MTQTTTFNSDRVRIFEIAAVVLTAVGKFVFMDWLNWRFPFVATAVVGWTLYIIYRRRTNKLLISHWGFRTDNLKEAIQIMWPFGVVSVVAFLVIGYYQNSLNLSWHIFPILLTYPIWGVIQQFLIIALLAGNLHDMESVRIPKWLIILLTAILFSVVHYPIGWLMGGTFLLALFYGYVYLKVRNVYAMGLFHGWLGAIFYYTVVGSDPFADIFLKLF